jgi:hypothetical protein
MTKEVIMQIQGKTYPDLFYLVCSTCYTKTHNTYVEPHHIRTHCPSCRQTGTWRLDEFCWNGLVDQPKRATRGRLDHDETSDFPLCSQPPDVTPSGSREESKTLILMSGEAIAML